MDLPPLPAAATAALHRLIAQDADLAGILERAGPLPWRSRAPGFAALLHGIVAQMISNQAAAAIWGRLSVLPGALTPDGLLDLPEDALRAAGLSRPKVAHARAVAAAFVDGRLEAGRLATLDDETAIATISAVRGLGRWTAEVYLVFALGRLDVFPAGDVALAAAAGDLKRLPVRPNPRELRELAETWRPARAIAARLLWHHWRHVTGRPAMDDLVRA